MRITLYGTPPSPPSNSARLMLDYKGLDYKMVWMLPTLWSAQLRIRGFGGGTVPAMRIDGRKLQNSRLISRALEEAKPEPRLFPADAGQRAAVEEAERWGDEVLQDVPRRIVRWITAHSQEARVLVARDTGIPLPRVAAFTNIPWARHVARKVDANGQIQRAIAQVPEVLDHVDGLIADGVVGGEQPNAADFQIATSVRAILTLKDLEPASRGRSSAELAMRLVPEFGNDYPAGMLPIELLGPVRDSARS